MTLWMPLWNSAVLARILQVPSFVSRPSPAVQQRLAGSIIYCNKVQGKPHKWMVPNPVCLHLPAMFLIMNRQVFASGCPEAPSPSFRSSDLAKISFCKLMPDRQTPAAPEPKMGKEFRRIQPSKLCCSQRCHSREGLSSLVKLSGKFTSHHTKITCRLPEWLMVMQETNGILLACRKELLTLDQQDWGRILQSLQWFLN